MKKTALLILLLYWAGLLLAQDEVKYITLIREKKPFRLHHFHISAIHDDRPDTANIGIIHTGLSGKKSVVLKLQPGLAASLQRFIQSSYIQDTATTPIEIHISSLKATHSRTGLKNRNNLALTIAFYREGEKITSYKGDGYSEGMADPAKLAEEMIRKNLQHGLNQFNEWWTGNKDQFNASKNSPLSVRVEANMVTASADSDLIVFSFSRPLQINDFTAQADDLSMAAAVTYSGIQLKIAAEMLNRHVKVRVQIIPYFDKSRSWCRKASRNTGTLQHEQKHFDITALKACELLEVIRRSAFTANFEAELNQLHKQNEKEWDQLQREYDAQTNHGQATTYQQKWNRRIQEELTKHTCFK